MYFRLNGGGVGDGNHENISEHPLKGGSDTTALIDTFSDGNPMSQDQ